MVSCKVPILVFLFSLVTSSYIRGLCVAADSKESSQSKEFVLTLDQSNFTEIISKHDFVVIEFYAPWCGHCKKLAPEYEKAASILSNNDPPVVLAKVDANDEKNKDLANAYDIKGFPTLKIIRDGGKAVQDYKGPRHAEGIVAYLKKQSGPAAVEIKSTEDGSALIDGDKIVIVGVFPELSGEKFRAFSALAEKLRSDYEFAHTLDAKLLPRGDSSVSGPIVRLFKPFDELVVDSKDFTPEALEKFVEEASIPTVTVFNKDPKNHPFVIKFFNTPNAKQVCLFMHDPREPHMQGLLHILRYIQGTLTLGLHLTPSSTSSLVSYTDMDWGGCLDTRWSTLGYCVFLWDNLVSWSSKRQSTLSRSCAEAEYHGVANVVFETCWLRNLLLKLHCPLPKATLVYCDNVSVIYLSGNPVQHQRTKHVEIDIHLVRDVAHEHVRVLHVPSRYQIR